MGCSEDFVAEEQSPFVVGLALGSVAWPGSVAVAAAVPQTDWPAENVVVRRMESSRQLMVKAEERGSWILVGVRRRRLG